VLTALGSGCIAERPQVPSIWPPPDFQLVVEELSDATGQQLVHRRFSVTADGICVYAIADAEPLVDQETGTRLPVFSTMCVYRLLDVSARLLARKLHKAGVLDLEGSQLEPDAGQGVAVRLSYRAFDNTRVIVAAGQMHGVTARLLRIVNAHLPAGEKFALPGQSAADTPQSTLIDVPTPVADVRGALDCHFELLERRREPVLLLDAFALACRAADREAAADLLQRYAAATAIAVPPPFSDTPQVTPALLARLLPPASQ
jgi:hypothetical protein